MTFTFFGFLALVLVLWIFRSSLKRSVAQCDKVLEVGFNQSDILLAEQSARQADKVSGMSDWYEPADVQDLIRLKRAASAARRTVKSK